MNRHATLTVSLWMAVHTSIQLSVVHSGLIYMYTSNIICDHHGPSRRNAGANNKLRREYDHRTCHRISRLRKRFHLMRSLLCLLSFGRLGLSTDRRLLWFCGFLILLNHVQRRGQACVINLIYISRKGKFETVEVI